MNTEYAYVDESSINAEVICSICYSPFIDPYDTPCDETFCYKCIVDWIQFQNNYSCPLCRKPLSIDSLKKSSRVIRNILNQLPVECKTCGHRNIPRGDFENHVERVCPRTIVSCTSKNVKCKWKGEREQLDQHLIDCQWKYKKSFFRYFITKFSIFGRQTIQSNEKSEPTYQSNNNFHNWQNQSHHLNSSTSLPSNVSVQSNQKPKNMNDRRNRSTYYNNYNLSRIFLVILFVNIAFLFIVNRKRSDAFTKNTTSQSVNQLTNNDIQVPILCSNINECLSANISFEDTKLLTDEYQTYLNYFYNDSDSRILKWKLIYRGSQHGFNAKAFHSYCDDRGETIIVLSSSKGSLFGGYTNVNWTTPSARIPQYRRSTKAFLFSLTSNHNTPARRFSIASQYVDYAIVNDDLSGPIFGDMNKPDIGVYESEGKFQCQNNFPSVYKGSIGTSCFPNSQECLINEIEVFAPILKTRSFPLYSISNIIPHLFNTYTGFSSFCLVTFFYNSNRPVIARIFSLINILFIIVNYHYGYLSILPTLYLITIGFQWNYRLSIPTSVHIQNEKRLIMLSIFFLTSTILFAY